MHPIPDCRSKLPDFIKFGQVLFPPFNQEKSSSMTNWMPLIASRPVRATILSLRRVNRCINAWAMVGVVVTPSVAAQVTLQMSNHQPDTDLTVNKTNPSKVKNNLEDSPYPDGHEPGDKGHSAPMAKCQSR